MELIRFYLSSANLPHRKLVFHSAIAGGANVLVLALLNAAADNASNSEVEFLLLILFTLNILVFLLSQKFIWRTATIEVEKLVHKERLSLIDKVNAGNLEKLERMEKSDIYAAINHHCGNIAFAGVPTIVSLQSIILLAFTLLYIAWMSLSAFVLLGSFLAIAVYYSFKRAKDSNNNYAVSIAQEQNAYAVISDLLEGFKEVKLNQKREKALLEDVEQLSFEAEAARMSANQHLAMSYVVTQASFYITIAMMVFLLPIFDPTTFIGVVVSVTTAAIFITGPINVIISVIPTYTNSQASLLFVRKMDETLDSAKELNSQQVNELDTLQRLSFDNLSYQFESNGQEGFAVGPVNLDINAGDIVFFTGGNGSGKSTLIKAMLGLYAINSGTIKYNDKVIDVDDLASYRNCFSAIFSDYHLFKQLYGIEQLDEGEAQELLKLFELDDKTTLEDGAFSTQHLSTGQRKRLALIVAILEDRPVIVLDEWAADQDPTYRKVFYREILPRLKAKGTTILAITHDEQYFDLCDHRYHLVDGKIASQHSKEASSRSTRRPSQPMS